MTDSKFDSKKLEHYVKVLTDNYRLKIGDLQDYPEINKSYNVINDLTINPDKKDNIVKLLLKQYRPSQIVPETVGSFLFGCFQQSYGDIPSECSPLCSYGIRNDDGLILQQCNSQIHIQYLEDIPSNGESRFTKLGRSTSKQGYIFVNLNFMGFTTREKEYFENNGLQKMQVLVTKDSKHHTILKMRDLNDIPIIEKSKTGEIVLTSEQNTVESYSNEIVVREDENAIMYIAMAIIIVIAVVAVSANRTS